MNTPLLAVILSVEPEKNGRALVTFRTSISPENPSGRASAYTPLLATGPGAAMASELRSRINHGPVRRRNTALILGAAADADGAALKVITAIR